MPTMSGTTNLPSAPASESISYQADLVCLLCGTHIGTVESPRATLPPDADFHAADGGPSLPVLNWRRIRCGRCGGAALVEEMRPVLRRSESDDEEAERPRRGRPPKWLVEQRKAQAAAALAAA